MDIFTESHLRANSIAWLPVRQTDSVCYLGKDTDVIAEKLRLLTQNTDCIEHAKELFGQKTYDYLICMGADLESELAFFGKALAADGRLVLGVENAYGMKYLAGTKEIASGAYFSSVEGLKEAGGYTKEEICALLRQEGFSEIRFYYPFPDYRFAMSIYSDDYLPKQGELIDQIGNFDSERMVLFDEANAMDAAIARGKFTEFSNSYLVVAGKEKARPLTDERGETISFVKFSNDRGAAHNIRTYITTSANQTKHLRKTADTQAAKSHIQRLVQTAQKLTKLYEGSGFLVNACKAYEGGVELEFLHGHTMEEELDRWIERGEYDLAAEKFLAVLKEIASVSGKETFYMTEEFRNVFGDVTLPQGLLAAPVSDIDLIMPNVLVLKDNQKTIIDYEWTFYFPVPVNFMLYRNIRYYADTTAARRVLDPAALYEKLGISKEELEAYASMEESFQQYVLGSHTPMRRLYQQAGKPAYHVSSILHVIDRLERVRALQVYFDRGSGFREEDTATYHSKALDGTYRLEVPVSGEVSGLRIDPGSQACTVEIRRLAWKGQKESVLSFVSNGHKMAGSMYLFDTDDPNILLTDLPAVEKILQIDLRIDSMSLAAAEWIAPKIDAKYKLKKILKR